MYLKSGFLKEVAFGGIGLLRGGLMHFDYFTDEILSAN
jgi:hypothetical protein